MTKLERAIAALKALPPDRMEDVLGWVIEVAEEPPRYTLTDEQLAEVQLALEEADEGKFATEAEMAALWKKFGL